MPYEDLANADLGTIPLSLHVFRGNTSVNIQNRSSDAEPAQCYLKRVRPMNRSDRISNFKTSFKNELHGLRDIHSTLISRVAVELLGKIGLLLEMKFSS